MIFRDDLKADLKTFVDVEEFGELCELDGVILPAQIIHHTAEKSARMTENFSGLYGEFTTIYFMREPYYKKKGKIPRHGEWSWLNGKRYDVTTSQEEHGLVKLTLTAYRQNQVAPRAVR